MMSVDGQLAIDGFDYRMLSVAESAYRMALDHPSHVERLCVLNVIPTVDQFERMAVDASLDYYPWFFLAQPAPFVEDRAAGHKITCPLLVHWGSEDISDPRAVWRTWSDDVQGEGLPGGHFVPEEASDELLASLQRFLAA